MTCFVSRRRPNNHEGLYRDKNSACLFVRFSFSLLIIGFILLIINLKWLECVGMVSNMMFEIFEMFRDADQMLDFGLLV